MSNLPAYTIRVSSRAKRALLKVLPPGKVEVVVPKRFNQQHIPAFVAEHRVWLLQHLKAMQLHYAAEPAIPNMIELPAIGECWQVKYVEGVNTKIKILNEQGLSLTATTTTDARIMLRRWLHNRARHVLPPLLLEVSNLLGLPFNRVSIRAQRTRWGSCSSKNNINLNRAMLFLSPLEVRYLMVHELCHTVHLNHSSRYWALVKTMMPEYKIVDSGLKQSMHQLPHWALGKD